MVMRALALVFVVAASLAPSSVSAQPAIERPVLDLAGVLSVETVRHLERRIEEHRRTGHAQIAVLVVRSTDGAPIADYAMRAAEAWRGGSSGSDDGALFVLAVDDREMRIEVGYGLEAALPDRRCAEILDAIVERLRSQLYDEAVSSVVSELIASTIAPTSPPDVWPPAGMDAAASTEQSREDSLASYGCAIVLFAFLATFALVFWLGRSHDGAWYGGGGGGSFSPSSWASSWSSRPTTSSTPSWSTSTRESRRAQRGAIDWNVGAPPSSWGSSGSSRKRSSSDWGGSSHKKPSFGGGGGGGSKKSWSGGGGGFGGGGASKRW